jgi:molybdopterin-guanine dinucleotide biosynthesis protein B
MRDIRQPFIVSVVGKSGSGKTTLIEKLIPELQKNNLHIGTIKHHLHDVEMDSPGKDSWRHKQAGAETAAIATPRRIGMVMDTDRDLSPEELMPFFSNQDLVLVEGYKYGHQPKVEIFRPEIHKEPISIGDDNLIAMISDADLVLDIPRFGLNDITGLALFLIKHLGLDASKHRV